MQPEQFPLTRDLVLIGGGHAHALVLRKWGMKPLPGARLTVINPGPTAPYTGMLPGHIAGHYERDMLEIDLVRLSRYAGARLILSHATAIDQQARLISVEGRGPVAYDVASIDIGITARMNIPGFAEHAVGAKPLDIYAQQWRSFVESVKSGSKKPNIAVIGGGVAGCELAMAMAYHIRQAGSIPRVTVIEAQPDISGVGVSARQKLHTAMHELDITLLVNSEVKHIEADRVVLSDLTAVETSFCVGAAGAFPHDWILRSTLPQKNGFIEVNPDLGVRGDKALFAVGDCANMSFAPRPKAGVFAVRAAPVLYHNLRAALTGGQRNSFRPQKNYLKLISLGGKSALGEKFSYALAAPALWRWKDYIDRKFMDRLGDLPAMPRPTVPPELAEGTREILRGKPLCGGCGHKLGGGVLHSALSALTKEESGDIAMGVGDDAAILKQADGSFQVLSTDHLRAVVHDPVQMTRIAAVHALGDVWSMGATPQVALSSIILPRMSPELQERTLIEITETAQDVFAQAGARLVGGHTTMGSELTIGFTVTGTRNISPITVSGAKAGDVLLLTRPIGSGIILAGHMDGTAPARVVTAALEIMETPQLCEAALLKNAHAMTDVTGFGLAGHVQTICRASGLRAEIWRDAVPIYAGVRELASEGVESSLLKTNMDDAPTEGISEQIFHDPQTAGGLLAALPQKEAEAAVTALNEQGREGWIIGKLHSGSGPVAII